jgi:hypothetical protein
VGRSSPCQAKKTVEFHFDLGAETVANARYNILTQYSWENLKLAYKAIGRKIN